jgi:cellulose synthase/poly-beta-1,6-N-acetylglucosamine synthase-like glycosyltransferase
MTAVLLVVGSAWLAAVAVLVFALLIEIAVGCLRAPVREPEAAAAPAYAVLVPAHDEQDTIRSTVGAARSQLPPGARLLVVADNCADATAAEARASGAEVIERHDPTRRGKGYALAFGIDHLRSAPPEVVIVLDADCEAQPGALDRIAAEAAVHDVPVQALYMMTAPPGAWLRPRMAAFAWGVKNGLRARGLHRLGLPCQLMGSGMAFPWSCIANAEVASGHLTEDLQLGIRLACAGRPARFCPQARVESVFPADCAALQSQRRRWEHGHLSLILSGAWPLVAHALRARSAASLALAIDLCIPPLALLACFVLGTVLAGGAMWAATGMAWPAIFAVATVTAFTVAVLLGWWGAGRRWVRFAELLGAPLYVVRKLPLYAGFVLRRQQEWVRTSRR